ncbi:hypothetical protein [Haloarcula sp. JP-L23]|uniref:hypothetical protein n=1 Tax=Haloarcula sp. JP-L23 TaxID=2716717 RepID=UPI00140EFE3D|nr:hypothetical protein G9465_23805 [Haloarcula sp. JP-L23]
MTDRNPEFDPADLRGAASSDPKTSRDNGDGRRGDYPTRSTEDSNRCESCSRTIPAEEQQCPFCATAGVTDSPAEGQSDDEWTFGRVVVAVVDANSTYHAKALGAAAFSIADDLVAGPDTSHGEVKSVADFETEPASHLTEGWPSLPAAVPLTEETGREVLAAARTQTSWAADDATPVIYREDGTPILDESEFDSLLADSTGMSYWVVPGLVQRYDASPDVDALIEHFEGATIEHELACRACQTSTAHTYVGGDGVATHPYTGRAIWVCQDCGHPRHEPAAADARPDLRDRPALAERSAGSSTDATHREIAALQVQEFDAQLTAYRERYGRYPWQ